MRIGSNPCCLRASMSLIFTPGQYSIVRTREEQSSGNVPGTLMFGSLAKLRLNSSHASRSFVKSISRYRTSPLVSAMPFQFAVVASVCGSSRSASIATRRILNRSTSKSSLRFSRCTFTTTSSPVKSVARCTCAREAAASGFESKVKKSSETGFPSSFLMMAFARLAGKPGTSFCKLESSSMTSRGSTSTRVLSSCPILMNVGPSKMRVEHSSLASALLAATSSFDSGCPANFRRSRMTLHSCRITHDQISSVRRVYRSSFLTLRREDGSVTAPTTSSTAPLASEGRVCACAACCECEVVAVCSCQSIDS
mmetsp:Transcript_33327/g.82995  ORF Transcript_33327/g.82995 Transcript_33327/m.82995 type:complete len:310 (-) Transcript_33327:334-1263(-)